MASPRSRFPLPFYLSLLSTLLLFFGMQALMPVLPLYVLHLGGTPADNGLVLWVFALASVLARPLSGVLADRWGDRLMLTTGALFFGGAPFLYAFCPNVLTLLLARAVHGAGMAVYTTSFRAVATELSPPERRGEGLGLIGTASSLTTVVAPLAGEALAQSRGILSLCIVLGALGLVAFGISLALPGGKRDHGGDAYSGLRVVLRRGNVCRGTGAMALLGVSYGALVGYLPLLAQARGLGPTGWAYTAYAVAVVAGGMVAGRLADRWGRRQVMLPGWMLVTVATGGLALAGSRWEMIGLSALYGLGWGAVRTALDAWVQDGVGSSLRASATASQYTAFDLSIGLGSWGLGVLAQAVGYGPMFGLSALAAMPAGWLLAGRIRRPEPGSRSRRPAS